MHSENCLQPEAPAGCPTLRFRRELRGSHPLREFQRAAQLLAQLAAQSFDPGFTFYGLQWRPQELLEKRRRSKCSLAFCLFQHSQITAACLGELSERYLSHSTLTFSSLKPPPVLLLRHSFGFRTKKKRQCQGIWLQTWEAVPAVASMGVGSPLGRSCILHCASQQCCAFSR